MDKFHENLQEAMGMEKKKQRIYCWWGKQKKRFDGVITS